MSPANRYASGPTMGRLVVTAILLVLMCPARARAQWGTSEQTIFAGSAIPWRWRWSALQPIADMPRMFDLPSGNRAGVHLDDIAPVIGQFWSAANPGALPQDLATLTRGSSASRAEMSASGGVHDGGFRRPMDPGEAKDATLDVFGWRAVSSGDSSRAARRGFSAIGRASFDQVRLDPGAIAMQWEPYGSSPFVPVDTSSPQVRASRAQLDGAIARRFGRVGAGLTVGYATRDASAENTRFSRLAREAVPAFAIGLTVPFTAFGHAVTTGAQARFVRDVETLTMASQGGGGLVYALEGYGEVDPIPIGSSPYRRRMERTGRSAGANAQTFLAGFSLIAHAAAESRSERLSSQLVANPPTDSWDAAGYVAGLAIARSTAGGRSTIAVEVTARALDGDAHRADLDGVVFRAAERGMSARIEGTYSGRREAWRFRAAGQFESTSRSRDDLLYRRSTDISGRSAAGSADVSRRLIGTLRAQVGATAGRYMPTWTLRGLDTDSTVQRTIIGPSLAPEVTPATFDALRAGIAWQRGSTRVWAVAITTEVHAGESRLSTAYGMGGDRRTSRLVLGVDVLR